MTSWNESSTDVSQGSLAASKGIQGGQDNVWDKVDVKTAVQGFVKTPSTNFGVLLYDNGNDGHRYFSSENPTSANRPRLVVSYTLPTAVSPPQAEVVKTYGNRADGKVSMLYDVKGSRIDAMRGGFNHGVYVSRSHATAARASLLLVH